MTRNYLFLITLFLASSALSSVFYVDNESPSNGNGGLASPWQTIGQAMPNLSAGDTLYVRGNTSGEPRIYSEAIEPVNSGTANNPIVVTAFPGEEVEIQSGASNVVDLNQGGYVFENLIFNHLMVASDAIRIRSDNNVFRNCEVKNGARDGFDFNYGDNNIIENCEIHNFISGSDIDAHGIVIDQGEGNIFRNNVIYDCGGDCIQIGSGTATHTQILDNLLYTTLDSYSENAIDVKSTFGVNIYRNVMYGFRRSAGSQGNVVVIHHVADSVVMRDNEIYDSNGGIRIGGSPGDWPRDVVLERNLIHDLVDEGNFSVDGYGIQLDGVENTKMYNNTFANIPGPLFWIDSDGAIDVDIRNNLFVNGGEFQGGEYNLMGTILISYNGWFNCAEQFSNQSNAIVGNDPLFMDPPNYDYRLQASSPCVDAGDPSFGTAYPGGRIDLGAYEYGIVTTIGSENSLTINGIQLFQNYPNPFNPSTTISFYLSSGQAVTLDIFDLLGRRVVRLFSGFLPSGTQQIRWDGRNSSGIRVASGVYVYRLSNGKWMQSRKLIALY